MAGPYYCDLDADFVDRTGLDKTTNVYTGPGGFMAALEGWGSAAVLGVGEILYVKGTSGIVSTLVNATVDVDKSGTWVIGDALENHNDGGGVAGDDWAGVLVFIDATSVVFQINAGADYDVVDTADGIDNVTRTDTIPGANMTGKSAPGVVIGKTSGTGASRIKIVGCADDAGFTVDGTRAVLDANDLAANCIIGANGVDYIWLENIEMKQAVGAGSGDQNDGYNWAWNNCTSHDNGGSGWDCDHSQGTVWVRCQSYSNSSFGFEVVDTSTQFWFCLAKDNSDDGWNSNTNFWSRTFIGCISHNNAGYGIYLNFYDRVVHCVVDENDDDGIYVDGSFISVVIGNRLTDNGKDTTGYGLNAASGAVLYGWNFLLNNDSGPTTGNVHAISYNGAATNETAGTVGYTDKANDDFNLTTAADLFNDPVELD